MFKKYKLKLQVKLMEYVKNVKIGSVENIFRFEFYDWIYIISVDSRMTLNIAVILNKEKLLIGILMMNQNDVL